MVLNYEYNINQNQEKAKKDIEEIRKKATIDKIYYQGKIKDVTELLKKEKHRAEQLQQKISSTRCLLCNEPSNAKHFCFSCYTKFKAHAIDIKIKNCTETEMLDEYGNKTIVCADGRKVRSRAEREISNFLYNNKIRYVYEKEFYYQKGNKTKTLHPDFYLPDYNLYIEYNELETEEYLKSKEYAMRIYKQNGLNVIIMTGKDIDNPSAFLIPKLNFYNSKEVQQWNTTT